MDDWRKRRIPDVFCPQCKTLLNGVSSRGEGRTLPNDGDLTVCLYCATLFQFRGKALEPLDEEQIATLPFEERNQLLTYQLAIQSMKSVDKP